MSIPLSGQNVDLEHGGYTASLASIGASLRSLRFEGRDLVVPFDADEVRPAFRGATLVPWPNRIADGRYTFDGEEFQVDLSEPGRGNALHGFGAWLDFAVSQQTASSARLSATIEARSGFPFRLLIDVDFWLDDSGLHQRVTATNTGSRPAPYGTGPHPYLVAGPGRVSDWSLELPAAEVLEVTDDRLLPTGLADVAVSGDGVFDFRAPRAIESTFIDHAFTGLSRDADGVATVRVVSDAGTGVSMTWGGELSWVQIHTADQPDPEFDRLGLAVEPMTCPPDAFNSGTDLIVIEPGESSSAEWTISAI